MKTLALLLLMTLSAHAECAMWGHDLDGNSVCMADDLVNRHPVIPDNPPTHVYGTPLQDMKGAIIMVPQVFTPAPPVIAPSNQWSIVGDPGPVAVTSDPPSSSGGTFPTSGTSIVTNLESEFGCLATEERVLRKDFSVGCAKEVHEQRWHQ